MTYRVRVPFESEETGYDARFTHLPLYELSESELKYLADAVVSSVEEMKARC